MVQKKMRFYITYFKEKCEVNEEKCDIPHKANRGNPNRIRSGYTKELQDAELVR